MLIWYLVSLTNIVYTLQLNEFEHLRHEQLATADSQVSLNDYYQTYPYIVKIKNVLSIKKKSKITMCTGTMLSSDIVLTTAYCVKSSGSLTVTMYSILVT